MITIIIWPDNRPGLGRRPGVKALAYEKAHPLEAFAIELVDVPDPRPRDGDGSWAERVAVDHRVIAKIPDQLGFTDAASLPIGVLTAREALFRDGGLYRTVSIAC